MAAIYLGLNVLRTIISVFSIANETVRWIVINIFKIGIICYRRKARSTCNTYHFKWLSNKVGDKWFESQYMNDI